MRILLAYAATESIRETLAETLAIQSECGCDRVIIGTEIRNVPCVVLGDPQIASARNGGIQYAQEHGYDWVILMDADTVVLHIDQMPASGFGTAQLVQGRDGESPHIPGDVTRWTDGNFILGRAYMNRRFCEDYVGYGFEDTDFDRIIMRDVPKAPNGVRLFHRFHPHRWGGINKANTRLYEQRAAIIGLTKPK